MDRTNSEETIYEKIREFRINRLEHNVDNIAKSLSALDKEELNGPIVILHCVPLDDPSKPANIVDIGNLHHAASKLFPGYTDVRSEYGSDGLTIKVSDAYCKVMNRGAKLEYASVLFSNTKETPNLINIRKLEGFIIELVTNYISVLKNLNVDPPIVVLLSILRCSGSKLFIDEDIIKENKKYLKGIGGNTFDIDDLLVPEIIIDDFEADIEQALHPIFNIIWNACGYPGSLLYDENENKID